MPRIDSWLPALALMLALVAPAAARADDATTAASPPPQAADAQARGRAYFGDAELTDQDGRRQRFYTDLLSDKVVLINVVFTRCPSACPLMTQHLKAVRRELGERFGR
ncbi:SCO family protein, partial [Staphylococcus pseudintermedius]